MRFLLCLLFLTSLSSASFSQSKGVDFKLYDTHLKREISLEDMLGTIKPKQVLIFGEQHDDSIGHLLEVKIFELLYQRFGNKLMLSMEMFHRDVQYIVDEYLQDLISEKNFIKETRAWETYKSDYRATVEFAKANKLKVIAANAPSRYTNIVTRKGLVALNELSKEVKKNYIAPLPIDTMKGSYYDRFLEVMGGHTTPGMNLYQSQNFWDATMSWSIAQAMKTDKDAVVFMMNGHFHSDYHSGLTERLEKDYGKSVTTISSFSALDFDAPNWMQYVDMADFIILTKAKEKPNTN